MPADAEIDWSDIETFVSEQCRDELNLVGELYPKKQSVEIDFQKLAEFSPSLAERLAAAPDEVIDEFNKALEREKAHIPFSTKFDEEPRLYARFKNLPSENEIMIRDCTSAYLNKFFTAQGLVTTTTDTLPKVWKGVFACRRCKTEVDIIQPKSGMKVPMACESCGRHEFEMVPEKSKYIDFQKIMVQEPLEIIKGGDQAKRISVWLEEDLVKKRIVPGQRIMITGSLRLDPPKPKETVYQKHLEANNIEFTEQEFEELEITEEEERQIKKLAKDPKVYEKLVASISPSIYGHSEAKEAILMQLCGGASHKKLPDGTTIRDSIHILLIGDPGTAKSQILKYVNRLAPKSLYVSGKSATGGGLTAIAEKDEFGEGGWVLKAGALVLASGGLACIDEFDKMNDQDRSAIHEALEQQSYHPDTEVMLSTGGKIRIGEFVDGLLDKYKQKIRKGVDCEILYAGDIGNCKDIPEILSCGLDDTFKIYPRTVDRISRHKAPDHFIRISYSHGRGITVTPEHPVYVLESGKIKIMRADKVGAGMMAPIPNRLPTRNVAHALKVVIDGHRNCKRVTLPVAIGGELSRLLGYIASEGHCYRSKDNGVSEIMVSNTNLGIIKDAKGIVESVFGIKPCVQQQSPEKRKKATKSLYTVRIVSSTLYDFFKLNFPEVMRLSSEKRTPDAVFKASDEEKTQFLIGAFRGDGFYDSERFGYATSSYGLARDYADLMLQLGIYSYIAESGRYKSRREGVEKVAYKVVVSGYDSMKKFYELVARNDIRFKKVETFVLRSKNKLNDHDWFPTELIARIRNLLKDYRLDDGYFYKHLKSGSSAHRKVLLGFVDKIGSYASIVPDGGLINPRGVRRKYRIPLSAVAERLDVSTSMVTYMERNPATRNYPRLLEQVSRMAEEKTKDTQEELESIKELLNSDLRFVGITNVERVQNRNLEWVYDMTIEPEHAFVSEGLLLHNTVSVAKAGIIATFKSESAVLAAANPKYSRFDPYKPPAEQFDIPPSLISRFDLIFPIKDVMDETKDRELATHILKAHKLAQRTAAGSKATARDEAEAGLTPVIEQDLLRKYLAYARRNCHPILTDESMQRLGDYYVDLRKRSSGGSVPLTPRQLEALVRLSEASAKVRLNKTVEIQDADRAIRIVEFVLREVGMDRGSGVFDIDRIVSEHPKSERDRIYTITGLVKGLEEEFEMVPVQRVIEDAQSYHNIDPRAAEKLIQELIDKGDLYEPRHGHVKTVSR